MCGCKIIYGIWLGCGGDGGGDGGGILVIWFIISCW